MNLKNFMSPAQSTLRVLFISFSENDKKLSLRKMLPNAKFVTWSDLSLENGTLYAKNDTVSSFERIVIGAIGENVQLESCLEECANACGIPCFRYGAPTFRNNKLLQTMRMKKFGIPQIKTVIARAGSVKAASLVRELKLPVVSKIIDGSQGKGVQKHDTKEQLEAFLKKKPDGLFIFQEFIPNNGDVRMLFVKTKLVYAMVRRSQKKSEFRNNISLGGKEEYIDPDPEMMAIAARCIQAMKFDASGVDMIQHKDTKEWFVLEINSAPQFMDDKVDDFCRAVMEVIR